MKKREKSLKFTKMYFPWTLHLVLFNTDKQISYIFKPVTQVGQVECVSISSISITLQALQSFVTTPVILTAQHCFFLASFLTNAQNTCAQLGRTQTGFHIYSGSRRSSLPVSFIVRYGCPRFLFIYYLYGVCAQHD